MEPEAEKVLKAILIKEPHELTDYDKAFLKARWSYVGKSSRQKFQDVLKQKSEKEDVQPDDGEQEEVVTTSTHPADIKPDEDEEVDE